MPHVIVKLWPGKSDAQKRELSDAIVREVTRIAAAASRIRIRFTNEFGTGALAIGAAHVALAGENGAIIPGSDHVVTFAGKSQVEIPQGAPMLSDPIDWKLPDKV